MTEIKFESVPYRTIRRVAILAFPDANDEDVAAFACLMYNTEFFEMHFSKGNRSPAAVLKEETERVKEAREDFEKNPPTILETVQAKNVRRVTSKVKPS